MASFLAVSFGCAGSASEGDPRAIQSSAARASAAELIGIVDWEYEDGQSEVFLSRLDPATLLPRGRRAAIGEFHDAWSRSPDGRYVALGTGGQGLGITIYDLSRMKRVRAVRTGIAAEGLAWRTPARVVAVLQSSRLAVVDPGAGKVLRVHPLAPGERACTSAPTAKSSAVAATGLVVMLRGRRDVAPRLLHMDAQGRVRSVTLPRGTIWGCGRSGLAVDAQGKHAYVVSRASVVADVELSTMTASYHDLAGTPLRTALPREALWMDGGHLVASGRDAGGRPAGVSIIDTATWTNRVLDAGAGMARPAAGLILTYDGDRVAAPRGRGLGLAAYRADGRRLFRLLRGTQINAVEHAGGRAYAASERVMHSIDLTTGRVINKHTAPAARVSVTLIR